MKFARLNPVAQKGSFMLHTTQLPICVIGLSDHKGSRYGRAELLIQANLELGDGQLGNVAVLAA